MLELARGARARGRPGPRDELPFDDASFDAAVSVWTHTDVDDFARGDARRSRACCGPGAPFVYIGAHPCFVGPHSLFVPARGRARAAPRLPPSRRYDESAPGVANPTACAPASARGTCRSHDFFARFLDAGFRIERFEELGDRDYPHVVALRARR